MAESTSVTWEQVKEEVGASISPANEARLKSCLALAVTLVDQHIGTATVPADVRDEAILAVAAGRWHSKKAPNGVQVQQFDTGNGGISATPIRVNRDPMAPAYPLLSRWVVPF